MNVCTEIETNILSNQIKMRGNWNADWKNVQPGLLCVAVNETTVSVTAIAFYKFVFISQSWHSSAISDEFQLWILQVLTCCSLATHCFTKAGLSYLTICRHYTVVKFLGLKVMMFCVSDAFPAMSEFSIHAVAASQQSSEPALRMPYCAWLWMLLLMHLSCPVYTMHSMLCGRVVF